MIRRLVLRPLLASAIFASLVILTATAPTHAQPDPVWYEGCGHIEAGIEPCVVFIAEVPINGCSTFELGIPAGSQFDGPRIKIQGLVRFDPFGFCMASCGVIDNYTTTLCVYTCCQGTVGNVDCDPLNSTDISDLSALIDHMFVTMGPLCCKPSANCDGSLDGNIDIADLSALIDHLFITFAPLPACP